MNNAQDKTHLIEKAKNHYLGENECRRMNCAQAVFHSFMEHVSTDNIDANEIVNCGGGRAPLGECGAYYTAKAILKNNHRADRLEDLKSFFNEHAGSLTCRDIRAAKKLSCAGCVEKSAQFLCACLD